MSHSEPVVDIEVREKALDPARSFIVQAPAGSGKTGLLIQRFLALLVGAREPEEIIAITFTRKAASEMRQRILCALQGAGIEPPAEAYHARRTWELARQVLERDHERQWNLLDHPGRLRIQTIDSLCASLAQQMPVLSRVGALPEVTEDSWNLYTEAAESTLAMLEEDCPWSDALACLIQHLDNRLDRVQAMIAEMLARRDQWLRHIGNSQNPQLQRRSLESAFERVVTTLLADLVAQVPKKCELELVTLAKFAGSNMSDQQCPIAACANLTVFPGSSISDRSQWEGLAGLFLTKSGNWRKAFTVNEGFPSSSRARGENEKLQFADMKRRMKALTDELREHNGLRESLAGLMGAPPHRYSDAEWQVLDALLEVLRVAAAQLELVFDRRGQADFASLSQAALTALGEPDAPTDLTLALDYRITHILVDEFQDTSVNQYQLLNRLTSGWQPGDGHTLFVVGDPMQSIYRFREAEVGLFLAAKQHGIGNVYMEPLSLTVNFRSQRGIVDWLNRSFPAILAKSDDFNNGAVSYFPSDGFRSRLEGSGVEFHPVLGRDDLSEALQVERIVRESQRENPENRIAILVRSRSHLETIVLQLRRAGLRFQAVEIEQLAERPVVQDLLALTRALSHQADRLAWLALLRAPFCGLTLKDIYTLAADAPADTVFGLLHQMPRVQSLSDDGRDRIRRLLPVLEAAVLQRGRVNLRRQVESVWIALGGPTCAGGGAGLEDAQSYFDCLEKLCNGAHIPDPGEIIENLGQIYANPDIKAVGSVQLMTIHKAKGLEFDTVIVPGLGRYPRSNEESLLRWLETGFPVGEGDLLLAPISPSGEDRNPMASYLRLLENTKAQFEAGRLLYVACTRAKNRLHLIGHVGVRESPEGMGRLIAPQARSLLSHLWPIVEPEFEAKQVTSSDNPEEARVDSMGDEPHSAPRLRISGDWIPPGPLPDMVTGMPLAKVVPSQPIAFDWAGETARHVGTVVHRLFEYIAQRGIESVDQYEVDRLIQSSSNMLLRLGLEQRQVKSAIERIEVALRTATRSQRGRWILSNIHALGACELAVSGQIDGKIGHWVIDRTFVDQRGRRWIIDYKTGTHGGSHMDAFLDQEQERYRPQLETYAALLARMDERPIWLGLYFPVLDAWREWAFKSTLVS